MSLADRQRIEDTKYGMGEEEGGSNVLRIELNGVSFETEFTPHRRVNEDLKELIYGIMHDLKTTQDPDEVEQWASDAVRSIKG